MGFELQELFNEIWRILRGSDLEEREREMRTVGGRRENFPGKKDTEFECGEKRCSRETHGV